MGLPPRLVTARIFIHRMEMTDSMATCPGTTIMPVTRPRGAFG